MYLKYCVLLVDYLVYAITMPSNHNGSVAFYDMSN
jgi:hypothetical protein